MSEPFVQTLSPSTAIERSLFDEVVTAAQALLGRVLVRETRHGVRAGIIVETEAYPHDDPACHAYRGRDARNATMFGRAGFAYVYRIHRSFCFNVVTGPEGRGEAVLVRALEPIHGEDAMRRARKKASVGARAPEGRTLTNGPGKLCQALSIDLGFDGIDLLAPGTPDKRLSLGPRILTPRIGVTTRIGISRARDAALRFFVKDNAWLSR